MLCTIHNWITHLVIFFIKQIIFFISIYCNHHNHFYWISIRIDWFILSIYCGFSGIFQIIWLNSFCFWTIFSLTISGTNLCNISNIYTKVCAYCSCIICYELMIKFIEFVVKVFKMKEITTYILLSWKSMILFIKQIMYKSHL